MNKALLIAKMNLYKKRYDIHIFDHSIDFLLKQAADARDNGNKAINPFIPSSYSDPDYWYGRSNDYLEIAILKEEWEKQQ